MTTHPFELPPGPERRELMRERGLNVSPNDFTPEEWAEVQDRGERDRAAFDEMAAQRS